MLNPFKYIENRKLYKEAIKDKENIIEKDEQPPIRASLINRRDVDPYTEKIIDMIKSDGVNMDYYASTNYYKKNKIMNHGSGTYAVSSCDSRDKFSEGYYNCTGVIAIGTDKETGQQVSFMSHQDPDHFINNEKTSLNFNEDLQNALTDLINQTKEGTVDIVIFGGQYPNDRKQKYQESIVFIAKTIKESFNIEPTILTGPNISNYNDKTDVYFNTQHRHLYLVRPYQTNNSANESYLPSDYEKQKEKWFKE